MLSGMRGSILRRRKPTKSADAPSAAKADPKEKQAATSMQARARGFLDRRWNKKRDEAATAIQASVRRRKAKQEKAGLVSGMFNIMNDLTSDMAASFGFGGNEPKLSVADVRADVDAPTPEAAWFTPPTGWPETVEGFPHWKQPTALCPTQAECAFLFDPDAKIGELRIEILEASKLPVMDALSRTTDTYATVLFEQSAARTNIVQSINPKWGSRHPRAFKFDVTRPFSCAYICLKDYDIDQDDDIGRVVIELSALESNVVYDCWYTLASKTYKRSRGKRGYIRIRYSVTFRSEKERMMRYLMPRGVGLFGAIPPYMIPMTRKLYARNARFAYFGKRPGNTYDWPVLKSYISEIKSTVNQLISMLDAVQDLLFWRGMTAILSLCVCIGVQLLISHPHFVPACGPIICLFWLKRTFMTRQYTQPVVHGSALYRQMTRDKKGLAVGHMSDDDSDSDDEEELKKSMKKAMTKTAVEKGSYAKAVAELTEEFDERKENLEEEMAKVNAPVSKGVGVPIVTLNPLAPVLGPVQRILGKVLVHLRTVRRVLAWEDRFVTSLVYCQLFLLTIVLLIIPWAFVLHWGARLFGFLLFGPHMHLVGRLVARKAAQTAEIELRYQQGDSTVRKAMLAEVRDEMEKEVQAIIALRLKHMKNRTEQQVKADDYIDANDSNFAIFPTRTSGRFRYRSTPILTRSRATPLVVDGAAKPK